MKILPINNLKQTINSVRTKTLMPIAAATALLATTACEITTNSNPKPYDQSSYADSIASYNRALAEIRTKEQAGVYDSPEEYLAEMAKLNRFNVKNKYLYDLSERFYLDDREPGHSTKYGATYIDPNGVRIHPRFGINGNSQELDYYGARRYHSHIIEREKQFFERQSNLQTDLEDIPILSEMNTNFLAMILTSKNFNKIEYLTNDNQTYNVFVSNDNEKYDISFGKINKNTFAGIFTKITNKGSEIYIFKAEQLETNKSNKLRFSKMRVVQDGLDVNTPTKKKYEKQIEEIVKEYEFRGNTSFSSSGIKNIYRLLTISNPEGKTVSIYSQNKGALKLSK